MATNKIKIATYITPEANVKVEAFMIKSGLTKSKTCALAIQLGIEALSMTFDPNWKAYFEAQVKANDEKVE